MFGPAGAAAWKHVTGAWNNLPNLGMGMVKGASPFARNAMKGAVVGAGIGGVTGWIDRDRRAVPGALGGAFWGALAGGGGAQVARHAIRNVAAGAKTIPRSSKAARQAWLQRANIPRAFTNARRNAAALVGAYGAFNFTQGQSRRRKHYTTFHHGEMRR